MRMKVWSVAAVGVLLMVGAGEASAQFAPRARGLYGEARLRPGFMPDPHVMNGQLGGPVPASQIDPSCRGFVSGPPSHVVYTTGSFRQLRFVVNAGQDSTLMVMMPNGQVVCDDDGGEGLNPLIALATGAGRIAIWVGAYSQAAVGVPYTIGLTELGHVTASSLASGGGPGPVVVQPTQPVSGLQAQAPPIFGSVSLRSGFMPDPHVLSGSVGGGPIRGSDVSGNCRGYYTSQPSHVLMTPTGFRQIRFLVNAGVDTTLLVMLPDGQVLCDDDGGEGLNPLVAASSSPGPIRVWVGGYSQSAAGAYNIGFTELGHVTTSNIPPAGGGRPGPGPGPVVVQPTQPTVQAQVVQLTAGIPATLLGPAMTDPVIATWAPRGGPPVQVQLQGVHVMANSTRLESLPPTLRDPTVTVTQLRNGNLIVRAEQPPMDRGDRGQTFLLHVTWRGQPMVIDRWSGTAVERGPRWAR
ncbi:MAG: hypothetical protein KF729_32600 [Sandaracinaceae bacterium]|nr:hypothetical protein [Sandaracinaceae bacterium]